jgi:putative molybdopterin biosynthesis protein
LIDGLLKGARPPGYWNQPRSHNAVAASVAQRRADWGIAIKPVADMQGLAFIPLADEDYDFAMRIAFASSGKGMAFAEALRESRAAIEGSGFSPAGPEVTD